MFTEQDLQQIADHGLTPARVETQLENFRRGFPWLNVVRAASPADGIVILDAAQADAAVARYEKAAAGLGIVKFVPASGAATRMFKELFEFVNEGKRGKGIDTLLSNLDKFAFAPELKEVLPEGADDRATVNAIVNEGLNYGWLWNLGVGYRIMFRKHFGLNFQLCYNLQQFGGTNILVNNETTQQSYYDISNNLRHSLSAGIALVF